LRILLDTHVLLWWLARDPALGSRAGSALADEQAELFVSAATVWEIAIKRAAGKLETPDDLGVILRSSAMRELAVTWSHAALAGALPRLHDDPFDRMLVAQAQAEELTLVTADRMVLRYDVRVLDAS
jgi:PIN domain nuclease of toxin-antitoxin system